MLPQGSRLCLRSLLRRQQLVGARSLHVLTAVRSGSAFDKTRKGSFGTRFFAAMASGKAVERLPAGSYPTMITPFTDDGKNVDFEMLDTLTEWFIQCGVAGLFSNCLSSEMYHLTPDERLAIAKRVHTKAAGRVPVVASGTFRGPVEEQAAFMLKQSENCEAVIMIVNQLVEQNEDDEKWHAHAQRLLELTGDIPFGIYESPMTYHRMLTPKLISWVASTGRCRFHKDTGLDKAVMTEKIAAAKKTNPEFRFFTAKSPLVKHCLDNGGDGFSGISANFYPWIHAWLCENNAKRPQDAEKVQDFLGVAENTIKVKYPTSAKVYLKTIYGLDISPKCRVHDVTLEERDITRLTEMHQTMVSLCDELGIVRQDPTKFSSRS